MNFTVDNSIIIVFKDEILPKVIPVMIFIAMLMLLGVIGNAAIIYIFGFRLNGSTIHFFFTLLAIFDIISCAFVFPMEILELYYSLHYPSTELCKFQRLLTFTCNVGSVIMLLVISIERYRKVCCAALSELSSLHRKIFVAGVVIMSLGSASPIVLFSERSPFEHHLYRNKTAAICSVPLSNPLPYDYMMFLFASSLVAFIAMLVFYYRVWRTAKRHFMMVYKKRPQTINCVKAESSRVLKRLYHTNRTVIAATALFALSFFPGLLLSVLVLKLPPFFHNFSEEVAYRTFMRLYVLNGSFNPFVYGYFNEQFRYETKKMLARILRIKIMKTSNFSSETTI